jgi:cystathionine beta-lyase
MPSQGATTMVEMREAVIHPFDNLSLERLCGRTSGKWRWYADDVLPLWVAEMDVNLAAPIVAAVTDALANGDTGYPCGNAYPEAVASFAADRWGWTFAPATASQVTDVMTGIIEIVRVLSQADEAIVVTPPIYPPFFMVAQTLGRTLISAPLDAHNRLDPERIEAALKEATAGGKGAFLLLSNPHNPTGTVHTREEMAAVARLARQYGVRVIADEIHAPLMMPTSTFTPYLTVAGTGKDFSVLSASKGWNLAGFKAAIVVPGAGAVDDLRSLPMRIGGHPGHIGVIAHTAAFSRARDWLDETVAGIDANRHLLAELLREHLPGARYTPPEGTYLAWIDCRELGLGDDPSEIFRERGKVALTNGTEFGDGGNGFVRLNLATTPEIVTEAVHRMASVLA